MYYIFFSVNLLMSVLDTMICRDREEKERRDGQQGAQMEPLVCFYLLYLYTYVYMYVLQPPLGGVLIYLSLQYNVM